MTPLVLITGFLGAGKTTLLQRLLPELAARGLSPFVILNDYVNADIDAATLSAVSAAVKPLNGGCVCCGGLDELTRTLHDLPLHPGRLALIEANGTTDVPVLLEMLLMDPGLSRYTAPVQVAVVDALRFGKRHHLNPLESEQTRTAGYVWLSRAAEAGDSRCREVLDQLGESGVAPEPVDPGTLASLLHALQREWEPAPDRAISSPKRTDATRDPAEHDAHHFAAMEVPLPALVARADLEAFIRGLPASVTRVKGVARLLDSPSVLHHFQRAAPDAEVVLRSLEGMPFEFPPVILFLGPRLPALSLRTAVSGLSPF